MNEEYKNEILLAVAEEAVKKDKDRGMIIDNPSGYLKYKMERARHQANEDPAWLLKQRDRLLGPTRPPLGFNVCARCGAPIQPSVTFEVNGEMYCDIGCAEGTNSVCSLMDYLVALRAAGQRTSTHPEHGEITVTWENAKRVWPAQCAKVEGEQDEF